MLKKAFYLLQNCMFVCGSVCLFVLAKLKNGSTEYDGTFTAFDAGYFIKALSKTST